MNNQTRESEHKIETIPKHQKPKPRIFFFFKSVVFLEYNISMKAVCTKCYLRWLGEQPNTGLLLKEFSAFTASGKNHCNQWSHLNSQDFGLLLKVVFPCTISTDY